MCVTVLILLKRRKSEMGKDKAHLVTKYGDIWISDPDTLRLARMYIRLLDLEFNGAKEIPDWMVVVANVLGKNPLSQ